MIYLETLNLASLDDKIPVDAAYLDFRKAFDSVLYPNSMVMAFEDRSYNG